MGVRLQMGLSLGQGLINANHTSESSISLRNNMVSRRQQVKCLEKDAIINKVLKEKVDMERTDRRGEHWEKKTGKPGPKASTHTLLGTSVEP